MKENKQELGKGDPFFDLYRGFAKSSPYRAHNAVEIAHMLCALKLRQGDTAVDCTMGNGRDTALLCRLVGDAGKVYAFDIQKRALAQTRERLRALKLLAGAELILDGHQRLTEYVTGKVQLVIFNLGYLPGGNHEIVTQEETTLEAVRGSLEILKTGGLVVIVVYPGQASGKREGEALMRMTSQLSQKDFQVMQIRFTNQINHPPELICVEKVGEVGE